MRTESEVRRRLQQRRYRHQKRYLSEMLGRKHSNCRFNAKAEASHGVGGCVCTHPDLVRRETVDVPIGALIAKVPRVTLPVCDSGVMKDQAPNCEKFETRSSKDRVKADFKRILSEAAADMDKFAAMWPDMAQLIWVLKPGATELPPDFNAIDSDEFDVLDQVADKPTEDLELRAMPGAHLQIGGPVVAKTPVEHRGYVAESTNNLVPHEPTPPKPGWIVSLLRWLLSKVERHG